MSMAQQVLLHDKWGLELGLGQDKRISITTLGLLSLFRSRRSYR